MSKITPEAESKVDNIEVTEDLHTPGLEGKANNNMMSSDV